MTYYTGNTVSSFNFMDFRGDFGPNTPYPSETIAAQGAVAALIGFGYGTRGYGQLNTFLPPKSPGNRISSVEWNAMQSAMSNINIHSGAGLTLQPRVSANGRIIAEDGVDSTANIAALVNSLDVARNDYDPGQLSTDIALLNERTTSWNGTITHEFTVDFDSEDHARWFFNSGGAIDISGDRTGGTVTSSTVIVAPFMSPRLYPATTNKWQTFMNSYAVWVDPTANEKPDRSNEIYVYYRNFVAPINGTYRIRFQGDDRLTLYVDGVLIGTNFNSEAGPSEAVLDLDAGNHVLRIEFLNITLPTGKTLWKYNPGGGAITIEHIFWNTRDSLAAETIPGNPSFLSPDVYALPVSAIWGKFMNSYSVWVNPATELLKNQTQIIYRQFTAPLTGVYKFYLAADDRLKLSVNGVQRAEIYRNFDDPEPAVVSLNLSAGNHTLKFEVLNDGDGNSWSNNPAGWAVIIASDIIWNTRTNSAEDYVVDTSFKSPAVFSVTDVDWNTFLNTYAVWVKADRNAGTLVVHNRHRLLNITRTGNYSIYYAADDTMRVYLNDVEIIYATGETSRKSSQPSLKVLKIDQGTHVIRVDISNKTNQGGWAIVIKDSTGKIVWTTRDALSAETVPGPQGPNVTIYNDGTANARISNLFVNAGTVSIEGTVALAINNGSGFGNINSDAGYYNLESDYTTVYSHYDAPGVTSVNELVQTYAAPTVEYTYTVPFDTVQLTFKLWGAGGAGGAMYSPGIANSGGAGAFVQGTVDVIPGESLRIIVGGGGKPGISVNNSWNDTYGGGGGGYSGVFRGDTPLLIAGGGGGSPANYYDQNQGEVVWNTRSALGAETVDLPPPTLSPAVFSVSNAAWSAFMNEYAVWTRNSSQNPGPVTEKIYRNLVIADSGNYIFRYAADTRLTLKVDGVEVGTVESFRGEPKQTIIDLDQGLHLLEFTAFNRENNSPAGYAVAILKPRPGGQGGAAGISLGSPGLIGNGVVNSTGGTQTAGGQGGTGDSAAKKGDRGRFLQGGFGGNQDIDNQLWSNKKSYQTNTVYPQGINGGLTGGAQGGAQGSGGGGGGYFGGGGGGAASPGGALYSPGGGAGGSCYIAPAVTDVVTAVSSDGVRAPRRSDVAYRTGTASGGQGGKTVGDLGAPGGNGLIAVYKTGVIVPPNSENWVVEAKVEQVSGTYGGNGSRIRIRSHISSNIIVDSSGTVSTAKPAFVSIIDESSQTVQAMENSYQLFRARYPEHRLYLLWPRTTETISDLKIPPSWGSNQYDIGPIQVKEDNGNPDLRNDWFSLCALDDLPAGSQIGIFLDTSDSLGYNAVKASFELFVKNLADRNIIQATTRDDHENWIIPFLYMTATVPDTKPIITQNTVDGTTRSIIKRRKAVGVLKIDEPKFDTTIPLRRGGVIQDPPVEPIKINPTCITVIDEVSPTPATIQASYDRFRKNNPDAYLYLLQPKRSSQSTVQVPNGWSTASGDFGPIQVKRDEGRRSDISDWYALATLDRLPDNSTIQLFIDVSGSMTLNTVQASYDYFKVRCAERNINILLYTNQQEDWIAVFNQKN